MLTDSDSDFADSMMLAVVDDPAALQMLRDVLAYDKTGEETKKWEANLHNLLKRLEGKPRQCRYRDPSYLRLLMRIYVRSPGVAKIVGESGLLAMGHGNTMSAYLDPYKPLASGSVRMTSSRCTPRATKTCAPPWRRKVATCSLNGLGASQLTR